jgi:hypothetical protein
MKSQINWNNKIIEIILAFKRAEDDKLMKFQRAAEFRREAALWRERPVY